MIARMRLDRVWWTGLLVVALVAGCGKSDQPGTTADGSKLPTASIGGPAEDEDAEEPDDEPAVREDPKEGTPEWMVREAMKLRLESPPATEDLEKLKTHRKERNEKIISLCQEAIKQTHGNAEKERVFNFAVQNLLEARLQMALTDDRDATDALYEDAAALYRRDPKSPAAAEGAHALVNLAYTKAKQVGSDYQEWLGEFSKQAMHFADNFPNDTQRSLPLLYTAARSCELGGQPKEAIAAYNLLQQKFANSPYSARSAAIIRRLKLPGNPAQLAGPTLQGEQFVVDDLLGQPVLVVFWASEAKPFVDALPQVLEATRDLAKRKVQIVGVNLDQNAAAANQFVIKHKLPWPQIFFPEPERQGWNNPVAVYYGIMEIPAFWLIDQSGNVVSTSLTADTIAAEAGKLLATPAAAP